MVKNSEGEIIEIHCTYDPESKSGSGTEASKRKVKGTLHWVSIRHAFQAEVRLYDRLFTVESPDGDKERDFLEFLNPESLKVVKAFLEPGLKEAKILDQFQFQRVGYFNVDPDSKGDRLIFNRTVTLRDSWGNKDTPGIS